MRIAVTYENGDIFQHFGHTKQFKLYDIAEGKIVKEQIVDTNGQDMVPYLVFLQMQEWELLFVAELEEEHRQPWQRQGFNFLVVSLEVYKRR